MRRSIEFTYSASPAPAIASRLGQEMENPWYFPGIAEYATLLEGCGLEVRYALLFDRPTPLDDGETGGVNGASSVCCAFRVRSQSK